jgi:hypothetical protein
MASGFDKWSQRPYIVDESLSDRYELLQLHFHWSDSADDEGGSEHVIETLHYPSEVGQGTHFITFGNGKLSSGS